MFFTNFISANINAMCFYFFLTSQFRANFFNALQYYLMQVESLFPSLVFSIWTTVIWLLMQRSNFASLLRQGSVCPNTRSLCSTKASVVSLQMRLYCHYKPFVVTLQKACSVTSAIFGRCYLILLGTYFLCIPIC